MPQEAPARIARELASHGYTADREAITLLARADDTATALLVAVEATPDDALKLTADDVRAALDEGGPTARRDPISEGDDGASPDDPETTTSSASSGAVSDGSDAGEQAQEASQPEPVPDAADDDPSPVETEDGSGGVGQSGRNEHPSSSAAEPATAAESGGEPPVETEGSSEASTRERNTDQSLRDLDIGNDMTGRSTGTGEYDDFVATFRDRYERLSKTLKGRVNHRNASALEASPGGGEAEMVGMVSDIRSTASGHWLIELEDTTGVFPCMILKDRDIAGLVDELLYDEVVAVEGTLSDDGSIMFVDDLYFPDVPRTHEPSTADRHVEAALISDVHVGSQEFMADAWERFAAWLHTDEAANIEYLLIAGDMVEGVGVYPDQDEELDIVDIFDQYEQFSERLKSVPGDIEIVMIPGNHDAVRLAEPQPGFDEELRSIMTAHDAQIASNPAVVTLEGVSVLMYHGVSLDEVIAEMPDAKASYDDPHLAMFQLLKKRHVAPQFGGHTRLAPEQQDYLVMDEVPDIFHTGHVHKLGWGQYRNVLAVNSGCWQAQTDFQKSVNIDPDAGFAPVVDLGSLDMTVHKFS
ncbi:DNA-directed DNA polymerase D exonuclease subunit DP1 [Natronomonas pharaonis DSM 2160]|uniref:DNA polymerase II small subunit n=1 Tax=Natronomonas pharaonis (strain ATCC 35678 / DSM 2160 / CIP 103997 / JCM 8858 / NBRC 14720 / NCIMB 2260 / Gabara) TaxID=348780 RepID=A0A1U7ETT3_NATPD|nr:DNA-directed DNA polymerase II small subunit [Natronomonas pharaonis]CAI48332.1 DNA-directed DNA polymerase D exonuclease subunit DP1 [Natronomonas pharaonis DSM 2160]